MGVPRPPLLLLCDWLARPGLVLVRIRLAPRLRLGRSLRLARLASPALPRPLLPRSACLPGSARVSGSARCPSASWRAFAFGRAFASSRSLPLDGSFSLDGSFPSGCAFAFERALTFDGSVSPGCAFASGRPLARRWPVRQPPPLACVEGHRRGRWPSQTANGVWALRTRMQGALVTPANAQCPPYIFFWPISAHHAHCKADLAVWAG